jgi:predicted metal-binding protein
MKKIGIIICERYKSCAGGKCFRALRERVGGFARYPRDEQVEVVGYTGCGGCPGGNIEYAPEEMKKNGAEVVHLATGLVVGYPPCPRLTDFKELIEKKHGLQAVLGTHPIPLKYLQAHQKLSFWSRRKMADLVPELMAESAEIMERYN